MQKPTPSFRNYQERKFDRAYANEMVKDHEQDVGGISKGSDGRQGSISKAICGQDTSDVGVAFAAGSGNAEDGPGFFGKVKSRD
jgi:hypothetical protein